MSSSTYRFVRVEKYFKDYQSWEKLDAASSYSFDAAAKTLALLFSRPGGGSCALLVQFLQPDTFRVRFNPAKSAASDYTPQNTRTVVMDTFRELREKLGDFPVTMTEQGSGAAKVLRLTTASPSGGAALRLDVAFAPFRMSVYRGAPGEAAPVWTTALPGIFYSPNGAQDFNIVQAVVKPATAKYIGFGEQGGKFLCKNSEQLTYFNFDNMRYRQVYDQGPFEEREPLYHSDPFFIEFNGRPGAKTVNALFIDNPSQVCVDVGYLNSARILIGTRFGDLDYYFFLCDEFADVLDSYTDIVGKARLKPRYVLGYHQGCYGYESRADLEAVVGAYRSCGIPLDGLHIDVDLQRNYQTFTLDESRFPNPKEMFAGLRAQGVKCSTNITPIVSNRDPAYATYAEGLANGHFVLDKRADADDPAGRLYQDYGGGSEYFLSFADAENAYDSGGPYVGEVYYGGDRGTTGHYPDLARKEVRVWWGKQYQYLFDLGLEMVWQDMTTPAVRNTRGDMRAFPFRLLVNEDFLSNGGVRQAPAMKVWSLFSYNLHKATYHGLNHLSGRENKRNFIIGRGSYSGMHRFAGLWTGDNASSWAFLQINVAQVLAIGMCGLAISGEDIGGFEREQDWERWADPELLMRWTAAGAFLPWFRNHYIRKSAKLFQEPYAYAQLDLNAWNIPQSKRYLYAAVVPVCRTFVELRYRLMQLFYDAMFENVLNGLPICRPMFLNDPDDQALFNDKLAFLDNQFFVREDLLVAPVLAPESSGKGLRDVYLPAGSRWYQFMNSALPLGAAIEGGTTIADFDAHLDADPGHLHFIVPLYVRAGAIIPTLELEQWVGERNERGLPNPITLNLYPGANGAYTIYLDDGVSRSSAPADLPQFSLNPGEENARGEYRETRIAQRWDGRVRTVTVERVHDNYTPRFEKYFFVALLHDPSEKRGASGPVQRVRIGGQELGLIQGGSPSGRAQALSASASNAWYYDEVLNISFVKVLDDTAAIALVAEGW